ncbi:carbohydrate ABC transporter permease [Cohnella sp. 56]|uniref:carbohydrate ABC transporter permease n=1 Tax=Cohnella sp. 56 TaxID=3113722 RepID=UPI0030E896CA
MASQSTLARREEAGGRLSKAFKDYFWGVAFLVPALAVFGLFLWTPIVKGVVYSFYNIDFVNGNRFVGWTNYAEALASSDMGIAVRNTLLYMFLGVLMGFWVPSVVAIAISELRRFQGVMRLVVYLPNIVPAVALYAMWIWLYDPLGPLNQFLSWFGIDGVNWLTDKRWATFSIVLAETWQGFGATALIYLAGIVGIPKDLYEAAEIDGAGVFRRIRHITLPGIRHLYLLLFIMQLIATSQGFQTQVALTGGGPNNATLTYMYQIINQAFTFLNYGRASALGVMMFVALTLLSAVLYRLQGRSPQA